MINIMFAGNLKVFDGILIASLSIVKYCKKPINVYVLTMDLSENNKDFLPINDKHCELLSKVYRSVNCQSSVKILDLKPLYQKYLHNSPNCESFYTPYALLRLLAEDIEELPSKILYLDADVVANGDISDLFDIDISNYEIAGARDYYGKVFIVSPSGFNISRMQ